MEKPYSQNFLGVATYNIKARYPDYKKSFQCKADEEFASERIVWTEEMQKWSKEIMAG